MILRRSRLESTKGFVDECSFHPSILPSFFFFFCLSVCLSLYNFMYIMHTFRDISFSIPCFYCSEASFQTRLGLYFCFWYAGFTAVLFIDEYAILLFCFVLARTNCKTKLLPKIFIPEYYISIS